MFRLGSALNLAVAALHATTAVTSVTTTNTQAVLRITTDQGGSCTFQISEVNDFSGTYVPVNDVDPALFAGADQCGRPGNLAGGVVKVLTAGKRAAELAADGKTRYSRALQANTSYYFRVTAGADVVTGSFTTRNVPLGNTRSDPRFDRSRPGEYAYPSIDWTTGNQAAQTGKFRKYVDPFTGIALRRASGPGELIPRNVSARPFSDLIARGPDWSVSSNSASYSGAPGQWLFLKAATPSPAFTPYQTLDAVQLSVTLSGSASAVEACLTNDGFTCSGGTITRTITGTPTTYTFGDSVPILDSWRNSPGYPSEIFDVIPRSGSVTKSGATVSWNSGDLFNPKWSAGSQIQLDGADCALVALSNEKQIVLGSSTCASDGVHAYTARNWGFLLRSSTAGNLTATTPGWDSSTTGTTRLGSFGSPRMCSPVKVAGPTGMGQVCSTASVAESYTSGNAIFWFGDDGTTNPIGLHYPSIAGTVLADPICPSGEGLVWDRSVAAKYYCTGALGNGSPVIYSVTYTGNFQAMPPGLDQLLSPVTVSVISGDLNAMVANFTANDPVHFADFSCRSGWILAGRQLDDLILRCSERSQESPGWVAVLRTTTQAIVGALATYGGMDNVANRWGGIHTLSLGGETTWIFMTVNPLDVNYDSNIVSGGLNAGPWAACPPNTVKPGLAGTASCSTVTLDTMTPLHAGASLYGQPWKLGDTALVLSDGSGDVELVQILTIIGNVVTVNRNVRPYALGVKLSHTGSLGLRAFPSVWKELWWNHEDDPHGQTIGKPYGLTIREDPDSSNCHEVFEDGVFLLGCLKETLLGGTVLRTGDLPWNFSNHFTDTNWDASFNGSRYTISTSYNEAHPSKSQYNASAYEKLRWFDARTYLGDAQIATAANVQPVATYIWKLQAAATTNLEYRKQGLIGLTGVTPLVDVSPAVLLNATTDNYKYCMVVLPEDCLAGSAPGEIYFNVPFLTHPYVTPSRFVPYPLSALRDVSFTQNTHTTQTLLQASAHRQDYYGTTVRRLTTAFSPYKIQSVFWTLRALPSGDRFFWVTARLDGIRDEVLVAELPPFPAEQSTYRGDFVPVALSIAGHTGDQVRIRFGYAENGTAASLYCHERQVACSTDASGAQPFVWVDEPQHWTPCATTCTVTIPAISGRVLYYIVDHQNGASVVSSPLDIVAVP